MKKKQAWFCMSVLIPIMGMYVILRIYPILRTIALSFYRWRVVNTSRPFVGFNNYKSLFADSTFWASLNHTLLFTGVTVPCVLVGGIAVGLILHRKIRFLPLFETVFFLPYILPMVPIATIWRWIYDPTAQGPLNQLVAIIGLPSQAWLTNGNIALYSIMFVWIWKFSGFFILICLVGLRSIPRIYIEAALVDGANAWRCFWHITLHLLMPTVTYAVVIGTIWSFNIFTPIFVLSTGANSASENAVKTISYDLYQRAFLYLKFGMGAAESVVLLGMALAFTFVQLRISRSRD